MDTLLTIKERLADIASNSNLTGPAVDGLVLLLADSVYRGLVGNTTELLERSFSRCRILNSAITHAFDRGYSVFRGQNQIIAISNVLPIETRTVAQYDVAIETGGYKLVYAENYSFSSLVETKDIKLILCSDVITVEEQVNAYNTAIVDFLNTGISEHVSVYRDYLGEYSNVDMSNMLVDAVRGIYDNVYDTIKYPLWVATRQNYGVSVVNPFGFFNNEKVKIKYLPYLEDTIDISIIPHIPGFISTINNLTDDGYVIDQDNQLTISNYTSNGRSDREININTIFVNANSTYLSNGVIKSYNDLENLIMARFGEIIGSISIRFDFTTFTYTSGSMEGKKKPVIFISYTDKESTNALKFLANYKWNGMSNVQTWDVDTLTVDSTSSAAQDTYTPFVIMDFSNEMKKAYYIEEDIVFLPPNVINIPSVTLLSTYIPMYYDEDSGEQISTSWSDTAQENTREKFKLKVYYTGLEQPSSGVEEVIKRYNYTFVNKLNLSRVLADLQDVDNVKYAEIFAIYVDSNSNQVEIEFPPISVKIQNDTSATTDEETPLVRKNIQKLNFDIEFVSFDNYIE